MVKFFFRFTINWLTELGAARVPAVDCGNFNAGNGQSKEKKKRFHATGETLEKTETIGFWMVADAPHDAHT